MSEYSLHYHRVADQRATEADHKESFDFLLKYVQTDEDALSIVGLCYHKGMGVPIDLVKAFEYWLKGIYSEKASERMKARCINNIGSCYLAGLGCDRDQGTAIEYFQKSADMDDGLALCNLAICYETGTGVTKDEKKAFELYQIAVAKGDIGAISKLAGCYYQGIGTKESIIKAMILEEQDKPNSFNAGYKFLGKSAQLKKEILELMDEHKKALHYILKQELETFLLNELSCIVCSYFE